MKAKIEISARNTQGAWSWAEEKEDGALISSSAGRQVSPRIAC